MSTVSSPATTTATTTTAATAAPTSQLPDTMKTIIYAGDDPAHGRAHLADETRPVPKLQKNHVLIRVHAVGLNPVDAKDVIGDKFPHSWTRFHAFLRNYVLHRHVVGIDFSGTVVAAPAGSFQPGDKVFGTVPPLTGSLAEYVCAPLDQVCYCPTTLSFTQAAALPLVGLTALQCLSPHIAAGASNKNVLVIGGSGGTGHVALQVARRLGCPHVTAVCSTRHAEFCQENGATHVVTYDDVGDENSSVDEKNRLLLARLVDTPGRPYAVVLDGVTSGHPADQKINYPELIQKHGGIEPANGQNDTDSNNNNNTSSHPLLTYDYQYRCLGGPLSNWLRAGLERVVGLQWWPNPHEKLFWIRFPQSAPELCQLQEWAQENNNTDNDKDNDKEKDNNMPPLCPTVSKVVSFDASSVQDAFDTILQRRVTGKVVVQVYQEEEKE